MKDTKKAKGVNLVLCKNIANAEKAWDLDTVKMGALFNVSRQLYSNYKNGYNHVPPNFLIQLAKYTGLDAVRLFDEIIDVLEFPSNPLVHVQKKTSRTELGRAIAKVRFIQNQVYAIAN